MTLFKQHMRTERVSLIIWSVVMGMLVFYGVWMWKGLGDSGTMADLETMIQSMPEAMQAFYGANASLGTLNGWLQAFAFGPWLWLVYLVFTGLFVAGMITREMDQRTVEFLLSLPVNRWQVILSRWVGLAVALLLLHLVHFAAVVAAVRVMGKTLEMGTYLTAVFNSYLLFLALGSIFLVISLFVDDYGRGVGSLLGTGVALFFLYVGTEQSTGLLQDLRDYLPFAFYDPAAILAHSEIPWADMGVLAAVTAISLGLATYLFQRKQITV